MKLLAPLAQKLLELRGREGRLYIYPHLHADGDAYGSAQGTALIAEALGIEAYCVYNEPLDENFSYLPGRERMLFWPLLSEEEKETVRRTQEAALMIDVSDEARLAERLGIYREARTRWILDHHVSSLPASENYFIFPEAAASCELAAELALVLEELSGKKLLNKESALCFYTGLLTDTGNFAYDNVSPSTLAAAALLLNCGVNLPKLSDHLFREISPTRYYLEGYLRGKTRSEAEGRIYYLAVSRKDLAAYGAEDKDLEYMPAMLRDIKGAEIALVLRETAEGKLRGSLRSNPGIDIRRAAVQLGGGGHVNASGFTLEHMSLEEGIDHVLPILRDCLPPEHDGGRKEQDAHGTEG